MSLAFKDSFDGIAFAGYGASPSRLPLPLAAPALTLPPSLLAAVVILAEIVIFLLALVLNPRARRTRAELQSEPGSRDSSCARAGPLEKVDVEAQRAGARAGEASEGARAERDEKMGGERRRAEVGESEEATARALPHDEGVGLPVKVEPARAA